MKVNGVNEENKGEDAPYTFIIQTGSNIPSKKSTKKWDDGMMILTVNPGCETSESEPLKIKKPFPTMTEGAVTVDFWLPANVGVPKLIKVDFESNRFELVKDALYVREITIKYNRDPYRFPIKNFVYPHNPIRGNPTVAELGCPPHFLVREGAGTLKHQETENFIIKAREEDLQTIHSLVQWNDFKNESSEYFYPGYLNIMEYDNLPRFLKFREAKFDAFTNLRAQGVKKIKSNILSNIKEKILGTYKEEKAGSFQKYRDYMKEQADEMEWPKDLVLDALKVSKVFRQDEEFGRQMLCGPNPLHIRRVTSLEGRWAGGTVPDHALEGKSVQNVIGKGHLFEVCLDDLVGIPHGGAFSKKLTGTAQTWYVCLADCLLYQRDDGKLVPVLIRLENRADGEPETWWSPPSPDSDITDLNDPQHLAWLYAKMWFRCADLSVYALCTHYARGHATNEIFAVAAYRNLPNAHPIFRLLQPHIQGVIPVNVQARAVLVNPGQNVFASFLSAGDSLKILLHNHYQNFDYADLDLEKNFEKRGVEDIPDYLYRDDTLDHWKIIGEYVSEMVNLTYPSDGDVVKDLELQNVFKDLVESGFHGYENGAGFPRSMADREQLVKYLTCVIVNISVFHTAVNFQTFTTYTFPPNVPSCLTLPPPKQDTKVTMDMILDALPVLEIHFIAMNISNNLGQYSPIERFYLDSPGENKLGIFGENMAVSPEQEACMQRMTEKMRGLKAKIDARNVGRYIKYDVLSPVNTPLTTQT